MEERIQKLERALLLTILALNRFARKSREELDIDIAQAKAEGTYNKRVQDKEIRAVNAHEEAIASLEQAVKLLEKE